MDERGNVPHGLFALLTQLPLSFQGRIPVSDSRRDEDRLTQGTGAVPFVENASCVAMTSRVDPRRARSSFNLVALTLFVVGVWWGGTGHSHAVFVSL